MDDWAVVPVGDGERRDFLDICDAGYQVRSTMLTSQLPVSSWQGQIGDPTIADSILDRLVHQAHRIELQGEEYAKAEGDEGREVEDAPRNARRGKSLTPY